MTTTGTAIFANETAAEVLSFYTDQLRAGIDDDEATAATLEAFSLIGDDPVVWLALAAAQCHLGRLDPAVRDRALDVVESGAGLVGYTGDAHRARAQHLVALRKQLTRKRQPGRRKLPPAPGHRTDLKAGDILAARPKARPWTVLRVLRVEKTPAGSYPVIQLLAWGGAHPPNHHQSLLLSGRTPVVPDVDPDQPQLDGTVAPAVVQDPVTWALRTPSIGGADYPDLQFRHLHPGPVPLADRRAPVDIDSTWTGLYQYLCAD